MIKPEDVEKVEKINAALHAINSELQILANKQKSLLERGEKLASQLKELGAI